MGARALDGVATLSLRPSVLDQPFLSMDELAPGMQVSGEVVAVGPATNRKKCPSPSTHCEASCLELNSTR